MFSHLGTDGSLKMVDVTEKADTVRVAIARGEIGIPSRVIEKVKQNKIVKGNVLEAARLAGIMALKKTSHIIPLCHPVFITSGDIDFELYDDKIVITCQVKTTGKTGVEMEALTGVSVSALTIYDMCKSLTKDMTIGNIYLMEKSGGKSGHYIVNSDCF